jgi:hypothetical protein
MAMLHPIRYICDAKLAPVIMEALAAQGYMVEIPPQERGSGSIVMVMADGMASVLLLETPDHATVEIECSGAAREVSAQLLESLPIPLQKDSGAGSQ